MRTVSLLPMVALVFAFDLGAQQPRDNLRPAVTGNARIVGVVVADDDEARPLRRARVVISGSELEGSRAAITGDDGVFAFERLPGGRYTLTASKDGYASMAFGALRSGRPGSPVVLTTGEQRRADLRLPRGAVITGMLRDPQGDPAAGVTIVILSRRFSPATAERRLMTVPNTTTVTDDRGIYRIFGLPAGAYLVAALPRLIPAGNAGEIAVVSREEVQRALAEVQERRASPRPGLPAPLRPAAGVTERRAVSLVSTYYPGTTLDARAVLIEVAAGEERRGIDFDLDYVASASVAGFVTMPLGMRVQLTLMTADAASPYQETMTASPALDGRFSFRRVRPGRYTIDARAFPSGPRTGLTPSESTLWARTEIIVSGEDLDGLPISLEPALTLSGEIVFDSADAPAPALEGFRLPLQIRSHGTASAPFPGVQVDGSRVTLQGVVPGAYRYLSQPQGIRTPVGRWWLKSILVDGKEILDEAPAIPAAAKDLRVTFSDRASELSGVVTGTSGDPVTDAFVVVFSAERPSWFLHSRRVAAVRLNSEGRYVVRNLPAGAYLVAISGDLENNEWFDPEALEALRERATPVRIGENEVRRQDFRLP